jgi:F420-non-reducing hydrogenase large subunit
MYKAVVNYMGTVDDQGRVAYYGGVQKVIDTRGNEIGTYKGREYLDFIAERVLPWSYLKMPYLKKIGWKGMEDGDGTSLYCVGPLARFNVARGMDTPLAQDAYEKMYGTFRERPVHYIQAYHWARAVEMLNAAEKVVEIASDPEIVSPETAREDFNITGEGVGIVEAPRGTLIHHYQTDDKGVVTNANLIVATTHNKGPINLAVRNAAKHFIKDGKVDEAILNYVEMAFRPYDLCLACATHAARPGRIPFEINIFTNSGQLYQTIKNF